MNNKNVRNLVLAALFLAIGQVLPFLTGQIPSIGRMLLPMHIPVLLCGLVCGWQYGLLVGLICPLLRSVLFSMPSMFPSAIAMAFEMGTYGLVIGLVYQKLRPQNVGKVLISLVIAMLAGRAVYGVAMALLLGFSSQSYSFTMFLTAAFAEALPGIILQLVLIPVLMLVLDKTKVVRFKK